VCAALSQLHGLFHHRATGCSVPRRQRRGRSPPADVALTMALGTRPGAALTARDAPDCRYKDGQRPNSHLT